MEKKEFPIDIPSVKDLKKIEFVQNEESWEFLKNIKMEKNDIIVGTYPKTGTTVLIHICHLLKGGSLNFKTQYEVCPFIEVAWNLNTTDYYSYGHPALFKSHMSLSYLFSIYGKETKIITTFRNPENILKSFYQFNVSKDLPTGTIEEFEIYLENNMLFCLTEVEFMYEAFKCRKLPNVCLILYDDLNNEDLKIKVINKLSKFIGVSNFDIDKILLLSSKQEMIKDESKFDDSISIEIYEKNGRPHHIDKKPGMKVTNSKHQESINLTSSIINKIKTKWDNTFGKEGINSYDELVLLIRSE